MRERSLWTLDIDQTLAGGVVAAHMRHYNQELGLGLSDEEIASYEGVFPKTFDVPAIINYRSQGHEAERRFQESRARVRTSREVHRNLTPIPGSFEFARAIADQADSHMYPLASVMQFGGYYSVRPHELEGITLEWLLMNNAPHAEETTLCDSPKDKLEKIFLHWKKPDSDGDLPLFVLTDDSFIDLAKAAERLVEYDYEIYKPLTQRLVIVAYGKKLLESAYHPITGIRTLSLPTFDASDVNTLKEKLIRWTGVRI
ncbi:MAG TPA: hypothetical protein VJL83_03420 [Patescibacteria group bacterium]|nr:hypothetical protein [Patescibacteria group bacterium]